MIEQTLEKLGLNESETTIFIEVFKRGKTTPSLLAEATPINRATVYSTLKNLVSRGIIIEDTTTRPLTISPVPMDELSVFIDEEERRLEKRKEYLSQAQDELSALRTNTQYSIPRIRFIKQDKIESFLYSQSAKWTQSLLTTDMRWWGFQDETFTELYDKWIDWYWSNKDINTEMVKLQLLSNKSKIEDELRTKKYTNRKIKFWGESFKFTATTWVTGDYVTQIITHEKPYYLIELHNVILAENMRELFKKIWKDLETK